MEGNVGVGRAGGGIGDVGRRRCRVGRVGDVPTLHGGVVDPGDGQGCSVGMPPEAAEAAHLLGGEEVGAAPRHRLRLVVVTAGQHPPAPVELADAQQPTADVGQAPGDGVRPGVEHRPRHRQLAGTRRDQAGDEQPPGEGEGGDRRLGVGGERRDASGRLTCPFAAGPLLGRQLVVERTVSAAGEEDRGIGDQALLAGRRVHDPQAVDGIGAAAAAQEHDAAAVGRDDDVTRFAERVPLRAGGFPGVRIDGPGLGLDHHRATVGARATPGTPASHGAVPRHGGSQPLGERRRRVAVACGVRPVVDDEVLLELVHHLDDLASAAVEEAGQP